MSADRQRLKSAIQRIAKEDPEIRNLLGEGKNKGGQASSAGVGTSEAESDRQCCDGSVSNNANPGVEERDPDAESQGGLDSDDPAKLSSGDGTLSGVTDCATGEPVCFDGNGFIPPEGWDGPNDPPIDPGYAEGVYYLASCVESGEDHDYQAFQTCVKAVQHVFDSGCEPSWPEGECTIGGGGGETVGKFSVQQMTCDEDPHTICDEPPPAVDAWPSDGCTNLAIVNGSIVGSKYDPENDGSYSKPMSEIQLCSGDDQISLSPSADGGWKTINSTTNNGYLYDSSGQQIAHIDGNEYSDPSV